MVLLSGLNNCAGVDAQCGRLLSGDFFYLEMKRPGFFCLFVCFVRPVPHSFRETMLANVAQKSFDENIINLLVVLL